MGDPTVLAHPTHHLRYKPNRLLAAVVAGLLGIFLCVAVLGIDTHGSTALRMTKQAALALGFVTFCGGVLFAAFQETAHRFTKCAYCDKWIWRTGIDYSASY